MDATRKRRQSGFRQKWYAIWRSFRFSRRFGFAPIMPVK